MRSLKIHPLSLALGICASAAVVVLTSQATISTFPSGRFTFGPHPRDFITIREGTPFIVPLGSVFIPTAIGNTEGGVSPVEMRVNGAVVESAAVHTDYYNNKTSMVPVPSAMGVAAGSVIEVQSNDPSTWVLGRLWGYLAPSGAAVPSNDLRPRMEYGPRAADLVVVRDGSPLTVPPGKLFVLTALGTNTNVGAGGWLTVDGANEVFFNPYPNGSFSASSHAAVPQGFVVHPGSTIDLVGNTPGYGYSAWGYFASL